MNDKKYLEKKSGLVDQILALSQEQAVMLQEGELDKLSECTDSKGVLVDELNALNNDYAKAHDLDGQELPITDDISAVIKKIIECDKGNIEKLRFLMEALAGEIKGNKEKIKVNQAYNPILGKEKNTSRRLDVKDGEK